MTHSPPASRKLYFVNPVVDYAMIGAASLVIFLLLRVFASDERTPQAITLALQLSWICNWPHFSATNYRLNHARANIDQYPMTALLVPLAVIAGACGSFASPLLMAPAFVKLVSLWSPYHFSGQTFGICMIYARRAGIQFGRRERFFLVSFIFATFIHQTVGFETGDQNFDMHGIGYPSLGLPPWLSSVTLLWMTGTGLGLILLIGRWCIRNGRMIPPIVLLPALAQFVWFVPIASWRSFNEFVPFFHSLQYLLIAWSMQLKEKLDRTKAAPSRGYVVAESSRWGALNFIGGALLFYGIPRFVSGSGISLEFATGVVISAVQIHHFFVDGVIWKLERQSVSSPLMVNLDDMIKGTPTPTAAPA